jgi:hypothetical protein
MATEPYVPEEGMSAADRKRLFNSRDPEVKLEIARKLHMRHMRGSGQMLFAIYRDPVCGEFMQRARATSHSL